MKTTLHIMVFGLLTIFFSCGQSNARKNIAAVATTDTLKTNRDKSEKELLEKRKKIAEQNNLDSLMLDKVLKEALAISTQNIGKDKFKKEYEIIPDSVETVKVEISLGNHFTKLYPHLIIRRHTASTVYIDIYAKNGNNYEKVLSHEQWKMEYMNDTIRDINGDGFNDLIVNCYGVSGCCMKAFSNIYLLRSDKKTFSGIFDFLNPTFSPKEKVIRGICYGHPGDTQLYKYKWNGEKVDTVEYISYQKNDKDEKTGKIIISKDLPVFKSKILKIANTVPAEYRKIDGYRWFTGDLLKKKGSR